MGVVIDFEAARTQRQPLAIVPPSLAPKPKPGKLLVRAMTDFPGWVELIAQDGKESVELCVQAENVDRFISLLRDARSQAEFLAAKKPDPPPDPPSAA